MLYSQNSILIKLDLKFPDLDINIFWIKISFKLTLKMSCWLPFALKKAVGSRCQFGGTEPKIAGLQGPPLEESEPGLPSGSVRSRQTPACPRFPRGRSRLQEGKGPRASRTLFTRGRCAALALGFYPLFNWRVSLRSWLGLTLRHFCF